MVIHTNDLEDEELRFMVIGTRDEGKWYRIEDRKGELSGFLPQEYLNEHGKIVELEDGTKYWVPTP